VNELGREELRPRIREERPPRDRVVVVRGGPATLAKLREHAARTHAAYVLDGAPLWGVSVFCALDDIGAASLDGLLRRFSSYRLVHLPTVGGVSDSGFELLPTFGRPHFTACLQRPTDATFAALLDALGPAQPNPYHGRRPREGR
jgi:hypothetical protein